MDFLDNDLLLYLSLIFVFLGFFLWNRSRTRRNRDAKKDRNFRNRYHNKKKNKRT